MYTDWNNRLHLLAASGLCIIYIFYAVFLSSLRHVPGPLIAKLTGNWLLFIELAGKRTTTVHALHKRYGPVVCIAPNELSFNTIDAVETIYASHHSEFRKAPWYANMTRGGVFNMRDPAEHRQRRKLLNHAFSQQSVNEMEPHIHKHVQKLVMAIEKRRKDGPVNARHWFRMFAFDVAGESFLGKPFGGLDCDEAPSYVADLDSAFIVWDLQGRFPILTWLLRQSPSKKLQHFFTADDRIYEYGADAFQDYLQRYGRSLQRKDLLTKLIRKEDSDGGLTDEQISGEISNLTFAATDTAAIALTYMFWELAQHPELQDELREELRKIPLPPMSGVPDHKDLVNLPLLNAVIQETLRKHSPVPAGLMRTAPPGGRMMEGYFVPEKTVVSVPSWTSHRNPTYFPDPESFSPHRWITADGVGGTEKMKQLYMPFTKGPRTCIGQAMGLLELRVMLATLVSRYNVRLSKDIGAHDMEVTDHFLLIPKGEKCLLDFFPVLKIEM
ncbi:hypothetical protein W97_06766 [Coniosporium apollinis CBS 100218]|uniref:Cytochrome P450 n=1 Tax=Coniosporium apollinis (strain CBS 100218) TaxID=1168221 RepID=R7Z0N1_CONA1|nr:uncharacterized protein W97_06766 [Coniosporium apollinis CBS 100218]EON67623.1 hypothetical protein W97_06766 [Coniosporium apollinis CBS 100218]